MLFQIWKSYTKQLRSENNQANFQPTLNKGARSASLTIFVTDCLQKKKKKEIGKDILKIQKNILEKVAYLYKGTMLACLLAKFVALSCIYL